MKDANAVTAAIVRQAQHGALDPVALLVYAQELFRLEAHAPVGAPTCSRGETDEEHKRACLEDATVIADAIYTIENGLNRREVHPDRLAEIEKEILKDDKTGERTKPPAYDDLVKALKAITERAEAVAESIPVENRARGVSQAAHVRHMAGHLAQHAKIAREALKKAAVKGAPKP